MSKFKIYHLGEVAHIERAIKNKEYPQGTTKIGLSATSGQCEFVKFGGPIETKYAAIEPDTDIVFSFYLYLAIYVGFDEFFIRAHTGMNLKFETLREIKVQVCPKSQQIEIMRHVRLYDCVIDYERKYVEMEKKLKAYLLDRMMV